MAVAISVGARKRRSTKPSRTPFRRPIRFQSSSRRRAGAPVVPDPSHSQGALPPQTRYRASFLNGAPTIPFLVINGTGTDCITVISGNHKRCQMSALDVRLGPILLKKSFDAVGLIFFRVMSAILRKGCGGSHRSARARRGSLLMKL
jgi:hypothetical protein